MIDAEQFFGSIKPMVDFMGSDNFSVLAYDEFGNPEQLAIHALGDIQIANINDYIVRGTAGDYSVCEPDIFDATYEAVK